MPDSLRNTAQLIPACGRPVRASIQASLNRLQTKHAVPPAVRKTSFLAGADEQGANPAIGVALRRVVPFVEREAVKVAILG